MTPKEILELRKLLGLSQQKLAELIATTPETVSRWENGKTKPLCLFVREMKKLREDHERKIN